MFRKVKKVHFVGIGGIGMSGIAELLLNLGFDVSGSDIMESPIVEKLIRLGADVHMGHNAINLTDADVLVYSSAVQKENPEIQAAYEKNIPVIRRAEMLGELIAVKETSIGVGGTHGKTTTSSMIGTILSECHLDPTLVVGGLVKTIDSNAKLGSGNIIVVEADEFDRSFLALRPTISIITNIELEHTDCYENLKDLQQAFIQFANAAPFYGAVIACADSPALMDIVPEIKRPIITYGLCTDAEIRATNICYNESQTVYTLWENDHENGTIKLNIPGEHNVVEFTCGYCLGYGNGIEIDVIAKDCNRITACAGVLRLKVFPMILWWWMIMRTTQLKSRQHCRLPRMAGIAELFLFFNLTYIRALRNFIKSLPTHLKQVMYSLLQMYIRREKNPSPV